MERLTEPYQHIEQSDEEFWFNYLSNADDLEQAVFVAVGAASGCWDNLSGAGVFESNKAKAIGKGLIEAIKHHTSLSQR